MKKVALLLLLTVSVFSCARVFGQGGIITTIAGTGIWGFSGDGGPATAAYLHECRGVAFDHNGNIYICDESNYRVRKINSLGIISTFAGSGAIGGLGSFSGDGAQASSACLNEPFDVATDKHGNVFISDQQNNRIRRVDTSGVISTFAGNGLNASSGDGGPATAASISLPMGICVDTFGNVYICEGACIRKINTLGVISTVAGNDTATFLGDGGQATNAQFAPWDVKTDVFGNLFIRDDFRIRKVNNLGIISTIAGNGVAGNSGDGGMATNAQIDYGNGLAIDDFGNIYFCDEESNRVRKIDTFGVISAFAGDGSYSYSGDGGLAVDAGIVQPQFIAINQFNTVIISERANLRKVACPTNPPDSINGTSLICIGSTSTFIDSISSGTWAISDSSIAAINSFGIVTGISAGVATISYSVSNSCGIAYATRSVSVNPSPISTISGPSSVCVGGTYLYTASVPGGTWGATNTLGAISTLGSFTPTTPGVDTLLYTLTNSCGTGTSRLAVSINPLPTAGVILGPADICLGATTMLYGSMPGGIWLSTNNLVATIGTTGIVSGITLGTDTIKYTVTNMCGTVSTYRVISIDAMPTVAGIAGPDSVCVGNTITLTDATSGGVWAVATGAAGALGSGVFTGAHPGTDTIIYTITGACASVAAIHTLYVSGCTTEVGSLDENNTLGIVLFPNPSTGSFTIKLPDANSLASVTISDVYGKEIFLGNLANAETAVSLENIANGTYIIKVAQGGNVYRGKVVVLGR